MITIYRNCTGKSSTPFIILCTMLFCFSVFLFYQFGADRKQQSSIEQAEFEQAYGKTAGSSPDYKELEADIRNQKDLERERQTKLKEEWLVRLDTVMQAQDYPQLVQTVNNLKQSEIDQVYATQALQEVLSNAVLEYADSQSITAIVDAGAPLISCGNFKTPGEDILKQALVSTNFKAFEALVEADCIVSNTSATKELIARVVTAREPERSNLFKGLNSKPILQTSVIKSMLTEDQQQVIIDYIAEGLISKDVFVGSTSILGYSIEHRKFLLRDYLVAAAATSKGRSSVYDHALIKALKLGDVVLVDQLVSLFPEELDDSKLVATAFQITGDDIKHEVTKLFIDKNDSVIQDERVIRTLLQEAVLTTQDYQQVELLLEKGASPNVFVSKKTLLGAALEKTPATSPEIIQLLREYGAFEDPLDVIRQERDINKNAECNYAEGNKIDQAIFTTAYQRLQKFSEGGVAALSNIQQCEAGVVYCKEQGNGVDACMASISSCSTNTSGLCCDAEIKETYFEGRCAGLGVTEAIMLMDVFSSVYGVPVNFR